MSQSLDQFIEQLTDSGICSLDDVSMSVPAKTAEDFANLLVAKKKITQFQSQKILDGKGQNLVLGNYVLLNPIGAGGMGQVFLAEHRRMKRRVALKMLPESLSNDESTIRRFHSEVRASAKLNHPNIVGAHDADEANGVHFFVMEYVKGIDLSKLIKQQGSLSVAEAVNYICQAAQGLEYAHKAGIVHRDIKPSNILLDENGTVKILDLGLARIDTSNEMGAKADLTATGTIMGTADYMSPEQAMDSKLADARSDIYSLGCVLYFLLTGRTPYGGDTMVKKIFAHRDNPIPSLLDTQGITYPELNAVYQKMVAKQPDDRQQTMQQVICELRECRDNKITQNLKTVPSETKTERGDSREEIISETSQKPPTDNDTDTIISDTLVQVTKPSRLLRNWNRSLIWSLSLFVGIIVGGAALIWFAKLEPLDQTTLGNKLDEANPTIQNIDANEPNNRTQQKLAGLKIEELNAERAGNLSVVFVLDWSFSMNEVDANGKPKLRHISAVNAVLQNIEAMPDTNKVGIIVCGHTSRLGENGLPKLNPTYENAFREFKDIRVKDPLRDVEVIHEIGLLLTDREVIYEKLHRLLSVTPYSTTPLALAITEAAQELSQTTKSRGVILIITDGTPTDIGDPTKSLPPAATQDAIQRRQKLFDQRFADLQTALTPSRINPVLFALDCNDEDLMNLECIFGSGKGNCSFMVGKPSFKIPIKIVRTEENGIKSVELSQQIDDTINCSPPEIEWSPNNQKWALTSQDYHGFVTIHDPQNGVRAVSAGLYDKGHTRIANIDLKGDYGEKGPLKVPIHIDKSFYPKLEAKNVPISKPITIMVQAINTLGRTWHIEQKIDLIQVAATVSSNGGRSGSLLLTMASKSRYDLLLTSRATMNGEKVNREIRGAKLTARFDNLPEGFYQLEWRKAFGGDKGTKSITLRYRVTGDVIKLEL